MARPGARGAGCRPCLQLTLTPLLALLRQAGVARFAQKYPAVLDALLRSVLEMVCKYHKTGGLCRALVFGSDCSRP